MTLIVGIKGIHKHFFDLRITKNFNRQLRGSRYGKYLNKEESKYCDLLKSLKTKSNKPVEYSAGHIPIKEAPSHTRKIEELGHTSVLHKSIHELLEEKITPLKSETYEKQLEIKFKKSLNLMRLVGEKLHSMNLPIAFEKNKLPCPIMRTLPSPSVVYYRNQDEFSIGDGLDGDLKTVGFYMKQDDQKNVCVSPQDLIIIKDSHKKFIKDFEYYIKKSSLPSCHWRSIKVRSNQTDELMGVIVMNPQDLTKEEFFVEAEKFKQHFSTDKKSYNMKSLYLQTCSQASSATNNGELKLLLGESFILETMNDLKFQFSPDTYFPGNISVMESVYDYLKKLCRIKESTTILEIFCGAGPLSLIMSSHVQSCIGIDSCSSSIDDAKKNAAVNNKFNVKFLQGNPEYLVNEILQAGYHEDLIVIINASTIEPSKAIIQRLRAFKYVKKIIYITTVPKTAMDNFVKLCKPSKSEGYLGKYFVPILATPFDLFPQTEHYGLIVMFQRL